MFRAYPRHSVDISAKEYWKIFSLFVSFQVSRGNCLQIFEQAFKEYIGTSYVLSIPSARLGLFLFFKHLALPDNSEIIISPFTHWSIFAVIKSCRFKPVFADIDERTCNIDHNAVRKVINKNTKVLILTHMWGQPCEIELFLELRKDFGIKIIEDCAMACGATYKNQKVGIFGDASIFSFGKAKAISTFGGGMLCTNDKSFYEEARSYTSGFKYENPLSLSMNLFNAIVANILTRPNLFFLSIYPVMRVFNIKDPYNPIEHKKDNSVFFDSIPEHWKVKMSNLQSSVGIEQLKNLDVNNQKRAKNANLLNEILNGTKGISVPLSATNAGHIYLYYAVLINKNISLDKLRKMLIDKGIDSQLNELTTFKELEIFGTNACDYPVFNKVSQNLLIIPNGIYLNRNDINYVGNTFKRIVEAVD
jgi:perosamine synthetase